MPRNKPSISDYYRAVLKAVEEAVMKSEREFVLETETPEIISQLLRSGYSLSPIEFDTSKKESMRHRKEMRRVPASQRQFSYDGDTNFEYEIIDITIPLVPNDSIQKISELGTSTYSMSWSPEDFTWKQDSVSFSLDIKGYGFKYEDDKVMTEVTQMKNHIREWVSWANADIQRESEALEKTLVPMINNRKSKLKEDTGRLSSLSEKMGISLEN